MIRLTSPTLFLSLLLWTQGCATYSLREVPDAGPTRTNCGRDRKGLAIVRETISNNDACFQYPPFERSLKKELSNVGVSIQNWPSKMPEATAKAKTDFLTLAPHEQIRELKSVAKGSSMKVSHIGRGTLRGTIFEIALNDQVVIRDDQIVNADYASTCYAKLYVESLIKNITRDRSAQEKLLSPGEIFVQCESRYENEVTAFTVLNALACGVTLTLVPVRGTYPIKAHITAVDSSGRKWEKSYRDVIRKVIWAPCIVYALSPEKGGTGLKAFDLAADNIARSFVNNLLDSDGVKKP